MSTLRQRFRTVVAMWIFVGLLGGPFAILMGVAAFTALGPFQPKAAVDMDAEFAPGAEVKVRGKDAVRLRPGDFMVLVRPADVDPATVTCTWQSRVYTTGEQRSGVLEPAPVEGLEPVVTDPRTGSEYRAVLTTAARGGGTGWMGIDFVTCDGDGVTAFALTEDVSTTTTSRMIAGTVCVLFGLVATGLGLGALALTRRWSRPPAPPHPGPFHRPGLSPQPAPHPRAATGPGGTGYRGNPFRAPQEPPSADG